MGGSLTTPTVKTTGRRKPVIGLAGGIGAGKSTVARFLSELGGGVVRSDELAGEEINSPEVIAALRQWWGSEIIDENGRVDRQRVASIAFADPAQRRRLEALLHPRVDSRRAALMIEYETDARIKAIVLDSPLLYEVDLDLICDAVIFIDAALSARQERSEKSRGWPPGELARREKTQQPLDTKRARADYTVDNNSTLASLRRQVESVFQRIVSEAGAPETHTKEHARPAGGQE
jgi:dephospho-CoA kinase